MNDTNKRFGSASLGNTADLYRAKLVNNDCFHMGFTDEPQPQPIGLEAKTSNIVIGQAGAGKLVNLIIYQMFQPENMIVLDPKAEISAQFSRVMPGYDNHELNPYGLHTGAPWFCSTNFIYNPFDIIEHNSLSFHEDCTVMAAQLLDKPPDSGSGNAKHFYGKAVQIIAAMIMVLKENNPNASPIDLYEVVSDLRTDAFRFIHYPAMVASSYAAARKTGEEIAAKQGVSSNEYESILSTISNALQVLGSNAWRKTLNGTASITANEFCTSKRVNKLFLMIPAEYLEQCAPILRCIITSFTIAQQRAAKYRLNIVLDEVGQLGAFEALPRLYSYGRGSNTRVTSVFQNIGQGLNNYGSKGFDTIFSNSQAKIILGTSSHLSAQFISNHLGKTTYEYFPKSKQVNSYAKQSQLMRKALNDGNVWESLAEIEKEQELADLPEAVERLLITPDELINMPADKGLLIFEDLGLAPYIFKKHPYYLNPHMAHRLLPNPFHFPFDQIKLPRKHWFTKKVPIISEPVPKELADLPQYSQGMWSYPKGYKPYQPSLYKRLRGKL